MIPKLKIQGEHEMAFFNNKKNTPIKNTPAQQKPTASPTQPPKPSTATVISKGIRVAGDISGADFVQIDGVLDGNIAVDNVTIGRSGVVNGKIKAKNVAIEGELKGEIDCIDLEIKKSGKVSHKIDAVNLLIHGNVNADVNTEKTVTVAKGGFIKAQTIQSKKIVINGTVDGKVHASEIIEVGHDGKTKTDRLESKKVVVNGKIDGKITASELLEVGKNGFVQGEITVKNIKTEEGGRVIGTMVTYEETKKLTNNNDNEIIDTETA